MALKELGRLNKQTLGFFPEGAFDEHATRGLIAVAVTSDGSLAGYCIYRRTPRNSAAVVHLCIHPDFRGRGIAAALMNFVGKETSHLRGVGLWCRNDFPAHHLWPRLGFVARQERIGKRKGGSDLTFWWKDHGAPDLLTGLSNESSGIQLKAAIDANVFFDLFDRSSSDSAGLNTGWLRDEVELMICPELFNEINRDGDKARRTACREFAKQFSEVTATPSELENARKTVESIVAARERNQDRSDILQLAHAVAGGLKVFVTRDDNLLALSEVIYERTLTAVVRPADLVTQIDALLREEQYQRDRLAGTSLVASREEVIDENLLAATFQASARGEKKTEFLNKIRRIRAHPDSGGYSVVRDADGRAIGLLGYQRTEQGDISITLLRAASGPLASSLLRYMVSGLLLGDAGKSRTVLVTDDYLPTEVREQISSLGFVPGASGMTKLQVSGALRFDEVTAELLSRLGERPELDALAMEAIRLIKDFSDHDHTPLVQVEKALWPVELVDLDLPAFIVPIRPMYAQHLFDVGLAKSDLFGANIDLALNIESIYYRSAKNSGGLAAPGRILWYVSGDSRVPGSGHIRASSRLEEVEVGPARQIFRKFRRLGIFGFKEVLQVAGGDAESDVMALRFSDTRALVRPVSWDAMRSTLAAEGINSTLVSPTNIPIQLYFKLKGITQ